MTQTLPVPFWSFDLLFAFVFFIYPRRAERYFYDDFGQCWSPVCALISFAFPGSLAFSMAFSWIFTPNSFGLENHSCTCS